MRQKTRIFIYILIAIAIVIIGTLAILENHQADSTVSAQEHIDLGRIYLTELSYEKAVLEFTEAIEIEPLNADAYLGLAEAYVGMGDTEKAAEVLEEGYGKTGDERFKSMLEELLLHDTEETTSYAPEETIAVNSETETAAETISDNVPHKVYDTNASYRIDVLSDKEAHIEIFSEIINDEYSIGYIPELNECLDDNKFATLVRCMLKLDNISVSFHLGNVEEFFEPHKLWTWNYLNDVNENHYNSHNAWVSINLHEENGSYTNLLSYEHYEFQWYINMEVDTSQNKLSFDVAVPQSLDFSFNNYSNAELSVFYYK
ncbi:MAG: tetratricopeptide repeat protein [Lachnospiraceae bacterium]|nr:tetratricopeptide repeat protein [Lachnospiraceae bacterium]